MALEGKLLQATGKSGSAFAQKSPKHPMRIAYNAILDRKRATPCVPLSEDYQDIAEGVRKTRLQFPARIAADGTVKHLANVVAIRTVCKEVESVTGIQLRLSTLQDHVAATDVVRKKGRPSVFTVAQYTEIADEIEKVRLGFGSVIRPDVKHAALAVAHKYNIEFKCSKQWLQGYMTERGAKLLNRSKTMETVRMQKTQPELGLI